MIVILLLIAIIAIFFLIQQIRANDKDEYNTANTVLITGVCGCGFVWLLWITSLYKMMDQRSAQNQSDVERLMKRNDPAELTKHTQDLYRKNHEVDRRLKDLEKAREELELLKKHQQETYNHHMTGLQDWTRRMEINYKLLEDKITSRLYPKMDVDGSTI